MKELVGLGQAYEIKILRPGNLLPQTVRFSPDLWWAWEGAHIGGTVVMVRVIGASQQASINVRAARTHIRFHGIAPTKQLTVEMPHTKKGARRVGLCVALAYDARGVSKTKGDRPYRHFWGDRGEGITTWTSDNEKYCPDVMVDDGGLLFLERRPDNEFGLDEWITG